MEILVGTGLLVSAWYFVSTYLAARRFFRQSQRTPVALSTPLALSEEEWPGVTILKPLKGLDVDLFENLATFCRQDYPRFQIVCAVADADDAAVRVVRKLQHVYPDVDIELVIDSRVHGSNYKVSNLHHAYEHAKYDYLVVADSDIRVPPNYLRRIVEQLVRPEVGVVTCIYRAVPVGGFAARLEALFVNTDFSPSVFVAQMVEPTRYAFGATMAIRREVLNEIGGFLALAPYLADDFFLGHRVTERGYRVVVSDLVVETVLSIPSWRRLVEHQLRWARTYRSVRPYSYLALGLTYGTAWATVNVLLHPGQLAAWIVFLCLVSLRVYSAFLVARNFLGAQLSSRDLWLLPIKDLFVAGIWAAAFFSNHVVWSGRRFRLIGGGEMVAEEPARSPEQRPGTEVTHADARSRQSSQSAR